MICDAFEIIPGICGVVIVLKAYPKKVERLRCGDEFIFPDRSKPLESINFMPFEGVNAHIKALDYIKTHFDAAIAEANESMMGPA